MSLFALAVAGSGIQPDPIQIVRDPVVIATPAFAGFGVQVSDDGRTILTGGQDGTFQFWTLSGNKARFLDALRIKNFDNRPNMSGVAYGISGDGHRFVVSLWNGRVEVWQRTPLRRLFTTVTKPPAYGMVSLTPLKASLLVGSFGGKVQRVDLKTGTRKEIAATFPLRTIPGNKHVVTLGGVVDVDTGRLTPPFRSKAENVEPISVSPDGKYAVTGGEDPNWAPPAYAATEAAYSRTQSLRIWRLRDGKLIKTLPGFSTSSDASRDIVWSAPSKLSIPGLGIDVNPATGKMLGKHAPEGENYLSRALNIVPVVVTDPNSKGQKRLIVHFPEAGPRVQRIARGPGGSFAFLRDSVLRFRSISTTAPTTLQLTTLSHSGKSTSVPVYQGAFYGKMEVDGKSPLARQVLGVVNQSGLVVLDISDRPSLKAVRSVERTQILASGGVTKDRLELGRDESLQKALPNGFDFAFANNRQIALGPDYLLSLPSNGGEQVEAISLKTGKSLWQFRRRNTSVSPSTLTAGRHYVAFATDDYTVPDARVSEWVVLRADTGEEVFRAKCSNVYGASFSPDGRRLAISGYGILATLDLSAPHPAIRRLDSPTNPHSGDTGDVDFVWSRDSRQLTVSGSLRPVQVFDIGTGKLTATMQLFRDGTWLAVRPDGTVDGSPSRFAEAKAWDGATWRPATKFESFMLSLLGR